MLTPQDQTAKIIFVAEDATAAGVAATKSSLDGVTQSAKKASAEIAATGKTAAKAGGGVSGFFDAAAERVEAMSSTTTGAVKSIGNFGDALQSAFVPATAAAAALVMAFEAVDAAANKAFDVRNAASTLQIDVTKASAALGGLVTDYELAAVANKGFAMGVVKNGDDFANLAAGIKEIAKQSGEDVNYLMESAIVGIGRKSTAVLDNLNVVLTQESAEQKYAASLGKTVEQLTAYEKSQAFAKVAIMEIASAARTSTAANEDLATSWKKGKVSMQNFIDAGYGFDVTGGKIRETLRELDKSVLEAFGSGKLEDVRRIERALRGTGVTYEQILKYIEETNHVEKADVHDKEAKIERQRQLLAGVQDLGTEAIKYQDKQIANSEILAKQAEREAQIKADAAALSDADHEVAKLQAMGAAQAEIVAAQENSLVLQIEQAEAAGDLLKVKEAERKLELLQLTEATRKRKSGGRGPSEADKVRAINEAITREMTDQVTLMELQAQLSGKAGASELEIARAKLDLAHQQLEAELEVLAVTRAKNSVERTRNDAREAQVLRQMEILDQQTMLADRQRENELIAEAVALSQAKARSTAAEAARTHELADMRAQSDADAIAHSKELSLLYERNAVKRIDIERAADAALAQVERGRIARAHESAKAELAAREAATQAMPGGTDEEKLAREDAQRQLMHDREIERLNYEMEVRRNMEAEKVAMLQAEQARRQAQLDSITTSLDEFQSIRGAFEQIYGTATQLSQEKADAELAASLDAMRARGDAQKAAAEAEIAAAKGNASLQQSIRRDQAKREAALQKQIEQTQAAHNEKKKRAEMRYQGAMLLITGAVEAVQAAVAFASYNFPQGIAHTAASIAAFTQGGMLMAGNVPHGGGGGGGGMPAGDTSSGLGSASGETPSTVPGSTPGTAADREAGTQPTRPVQSGTTIIINGDIKANGAIDRDFTENMARELDRFKNSREV